MFLDAVTHFKLEIKFHLYLQSVLLSKHLLIQNNFKFNFKFINKYN